MCEINVCCESLFICLVLFFFTFCLFAFRKEILHFVHTSNRVGNKIINARNLCCYIAAFVFTCFRRTDDRITLFRPETIVASFLHLMMLFYKVIMNHSSKRQFVVLLYCNKITIHRILHQS